MRRRLAVVLTAGAVCTGLTAGVSSAAWMASAPGSGAGVARQLVTATAPAAKASGSTVTVTWTAGANPLGTTYVVMRGGVTLTCTASPCTDSAVPAGSHTYAITPALGLWRGPAVTATETVASATLTITSPAAGATGVPPGGSFTGTTTAPAAGVITVRFYLGGTASGTPYRTYTATATANGTWSVMGKNKADKPDSDLNSNTLHTMVVSQSGAADVSRTFTTA